MATCVLPLSTAESAPGVIVIKEKRTILVIDDDFSILRMLTRVLRKNNFAVATATTGKEAWEKMRTKSYDVARIDIRLPDMEGTDLLRQMTRLAPKMVKIVFTGQPLQEKSAELAKAGADTLLLKPVTPEAILNIVDIKIREKRGSTRTKL
jgi:DNA-binding response OmpR family regulator